MKRTTLALALALASLALAPLLSHAELRRSGFLGLAVKTEDGQLRVLGTAEGGSAKAAGMLAGDVVTKLDGKPVSDAGAFVAGARALKAGDTATLDVVRDGSPITVRVPVKPKPYETAPGIDTAYGDVTVDGHLRRTLLTTPSDKAGRLPGVLFVTGIGCFSQEFVDPKDSVAQLLRGITRAGFATMRVEKTGQGDSQGPACSSPEADLEAEVRAYATGLKALKADPRVDAGKVFIVGLSIGGVEAPLIERAEEVRGVVAINTAAKPFFEYWIETIRRQKLLAGNPHDKVDAEMTVALRCGYALLVERMAPAQILARSPECKDEIAFPAPYTFMQQWAALNMGEAWKRVDAPVLVVAGRSDYVATFEDAPYLVEMLNRYRPGRATLAAIDGMDHFMTKAPSMRASQERQEKPGTAAEFEPAVLQATVSWMLAQLASGS